ncbi:hypothetical protein C3Z13_08025 [Avibacterium endocarditidis]|uniref:Uncharacterized protein n=1 Tax=Avibacterium endocarditidis TaxID=380674 RepID=A0ABX4ZSX9_9PAST|nr:hypothetical protein C3Z13_08025 [Avibacterium endocarditidis]
MVSAPPFFAVSTRVMEFSSVFFLLMYFLNQLLVQGGFLPQYPQERWNFHLFFLLMYFLNQLLVQDDVLP